jgi:hypothetical protein
VRRLTAVGAVSYGVLVTEDPVRGKARLVLAHVREQRTAVDVADRIQPRDVGHAHVGVDVDQAAGLEADGFEAEIAGRRLSAEGDQHHVAVGGRAVDPLDGDGTAVLGEVRGDLAGSDVHAVRLRARS